MIVKTEEGPQMIVGVTRRSVLSDQLSYKSGLVGSDPIMILILNRNLF